MLSYLKIFLKLTKSADQDLSNNTQATKTKVPNQQSSRVDFDDGQSRTGLLIKFNQNSGKELASV